MSSLVENNNNTGAGDLSDKIAAQGDLVRKLKGDKKPKEEITAAVEVLLALKVRVKYILLTDNFYFYRQHRRPSSRRRRAMTGSQLEGPLPSRRSRRRQRRK